MGAIFKLSIHAPTGLTTKTAMGAFVNLLAHSLSGLTTKTAMGAFDNFLKKYNRNNAN